MAELEPTENEPKPAEGGGEQGPGCLPAFLATGALVLIILFVVCGVSTWWLFQQRTELAIRTLQGSVIPELKQSSLAPEEKRDVIAQLETVVADGQAGRLEDWQASGIMERLNRSPILEWGDLAALEAIILQSDDFDAAQREEAVKQFSRLRRAVEIEAAGAVDVFDVLSPVLQEPEPHQRAKLDRGAPPEAIRDAIHRAELVANREKIPDEVYQVSLAEIVRKEIEAGKTKGGF